MFLKKLIDKNIFDSNGYVVLDTELINNPLFNDLINEFEDAVNFELKNSSIKKLGGYIMGNFGINQGPLGLKLYSLIFIEEFVNYFEKITSKKLNSFDLNYGGNLVLPHKGQQHFHTDGSFEDEMYLISIATEDITLMNGPTEICLGSNNKEMSLEEFFFAEKQKVKLTMKKGQILIRKHNLWHRGTKNYSDKARLLLSFVMMPKSRKVKIEKISSKFEILPNFFNSNLRGRFHEIIYVRFGFLIIYVKLIRAIIKNLFTKQNKKNI